MSITADAGGDEINVFADTIARWDDDPSNLICEESRQEILRDISQILGQRGYKVQPID